MTIPGAKSSAPPRKANRHWRARFLRFLAETSDVAKAARLAGIELERAYKLRRADPDFAREWLAALTESYLLLELEIVRRLREGDFAAADGQKFDFASAIRLLAAHRDGLANNPMRTRDVSAAEVRASIDRKIEEIRRRVAREKPTEPNAG